MKFTQLDMLNGKTDTERPVIEHVFFFQMFSIMCEIREFQK